RGAPRHRCGGGLDGRGAGRLTRRRMGRLILLTLFGLSLSGVAAARPAQFVLWAWERPEDLRFAGPDVEIAAQTGFVSLNGERVLARGRRFPLIVAPGQPRTAVVHVQIDRRARLAWTPGQRRAAAEA